VNDRESKNDAPYLPRSYGSGSRRDEPETSPGEQADRQESPPSRGTAEEPVEERPPATAVDEETREAPTDPGTRVPDESPTVSKQVDTSQEDGAGQSPATPQPVKVKVNIVGVRFTCAGKIYHFDGGDMELDVGDAVIVKTEKGTGLGSVAFAPCEREMEARELDGLRRVIRKAGKVDFEQKERCTQKEALAHAYCAERIEALGLPMKLVAVECFFDASKYVFYFTAEGRVDFRELVKLLVSRFPVRIEMRQIGVRHEAKMTGGLACCGQELCCSRFLTDFRPVSVKMAKNQNLSLNPSKISGVCGRLMCCLGYEHEVYERFIKEIPKMGKAVNTSRGQGVVLKINPLAETILVKLDKETTAEIRIEEIIGPVEAAPKEQDEREPRRGAKTNERSKGKKLHQGPNRRRS